MAAYLTVFTLRTILPSLLLQILLTASNACRDPRRLQQGDVVFSYNQSDPSGPLNWGSLNWPNWVTCGTGTAQSPIALVSDSQAFAGSGNGSDLGPLNFQYHSAPQRATLLRSHQAIEVDVEEGWGLIRVENVSYHFSNFHFHSPSEHTIDNVRSALEMHIVHKTQDAGRVAVLSILFDVGRKHSHFFRQFWAHLPGVRQSHSSSEAKVSIKGLDIQKKSKYWRYQGSLTTPPCSEGVTWTVMKEVETMSRKQMKQFQAASPVFVQNLVCWWVHDAHDLVADARFGGLQNRNSRPLQELNGRQITSYDE